MKRDENQLIPVPQQSRSRETLEQLIEAGMRLLRQRPWDEIGINDIASAANRSVGVFYQRFGSREDYLTVLLMRWTENGQRRSEELLAEIAGPAVLEAFLFDTFRNISENRNLWRAALLRAMSDRSQWEPMRQMGAARMARVFERIETALGEPLDAEHRRDIQFAVQLFNSAINNAVLNDPGPLHVEDADFFDRLIAVFRTVAGERFAKACGR